MARPGKMEARPMLPDLSDNFQAKEDQYAELSSTELFPAQESQSTEPSTMELPVGPVDDGNPEKSQDESASKARYPRQWVLLGAGWDGIARKISLLFELESKPAVTRFVGLRCPKHNMGGLFSADFDEMF
jgi:hypothetical protein